jgi:hypothetical protein
VHGDGTLVHKELVAFREMVPSEKIVPSFFGGSMVTLKSFIGRWVSMLFGGK